MAWAEDGRVNHHRGASANPAIPAATSVRFGAKRFHRRRGNHLCRHLPLNWNPTQSKKMILDYAYDISIVGQKTVCIRMKGQISASNENTFAKIALHQLTQVFPNYDQWANPVRDDISPIMKK